MRIEERKRGEELNQHRLQQERNGQQAEKDARHEQERDEKRKIQDKLRQDRDTAQQHQRKEHGRKKNRLKELEQELGRVKTRQGQEKTFSRKNGERWHIKLNDVEKKHPDYESDAST